MQALQKWLTLSLLELRNTPFIALQIVEICALLALISEAQKTQVGIVSLPFVANPTLKLPGDFKVCCCYFLPLHFLFLLLIGTIH